MILYLLFTGNFAPYIISYVRNRTDDTGLRNVDAIWVPSIGAVANCLGMTIGGILTKRFGPRMATAVGCSIFRYVGTQKRMQHSSTPVLIAVGHINFNQNIHQIRVLTKPLCPAQAIFHSLPNNE